MRTDFSFNIARRTGMVLAMLAMGTPALAQTPETRSEALQKAREDRHDTVRPYKPNILETAFRMLEQRPLLGREGVYLKLGSLTTGSGFAYGAGYRGRSIFKRHGLIDTWAAASLQKYWAADARATFPALASGRIYAESYASRREYPKEDFFGIGPASARDDRADFLVLTNRYGGRAGVRPASPVLIGGGVDYIKPYIGPGKDDSLPSMTDAFDDERAPGLSRQPAFIRSFAFLEVDYRRPKNARKGGWYRANFSHYADRDFDAYTFNRIEADLQQFVSVLAERRVFVGRALIATSDVKSDQQVPFYLMPTLGGNDTLRGFRQYRFRGPHALLLQGEYRWEIWSGLEGALFYDTGKVALRRADLDLRHLERDYGFGFRFNTDMGVVMRVDAGFGSSDGRHLYIAFGGVF